jgi:hypothetical protein
MSSRPELKLAWCSHEAAKYACEHWHYSRVIPKSKLVKIGAWEDEAFIGAVVFGVGATRQLMQPYGLRPEQGCELVRVALREHSAPVSRIVAIALKMLARHQPGLRLVVSFADPEQGHAGSIYQAMNWTYAGTSTSSEEYIVRGKRWHGRSLRHGKPPHLTTKQYAAKLDPAFKVVMGSSKHRYLYPLDDDMRERIKPLAKPYPKRASQAGDDPHPEGTAAVQR